MNKLKTSLVALVAGGLVTAAPVYADLWCDITDFQVGAYNNGGIYLHGNVGGYARGFITLSGAGSDFNAKATDRMMSLAVSAQLAGKGLEAYFVGRSTCSEVRNYDSVVYLKLKK